MDQVPFALVQAAAICRVTQDCLQVHAERWHRRCLKGSAKVYGKVIRLLAALKDPCSVHGVQASNTNRSMKLLAPAYRLLAAVCDRI